MAWLDPIYARLARVRASRWSLIGSGSVAILLLYYAVGGWLAADINPDLALRPTPAQLPAGGSVTAAMAARLIAREVDDDLWTPNDSLLSRTAWLDNKPAYQDGLRGTVAATVAALSDDDDVRTAAASLAVPSARWWVHASWPFLGGSAEGEYRDAVDALVRYNRRLAAGDATVDRSPERASRVLAALAARLDLVAGGVERAISERPGQQDAAADEEFYRVRGSTYAALLLLRALKDDQAALVQARQLGLAWNETTDALDRATALHPAMVGRADLTEQGYYLLLARNKLAVLSAAAGAQR